MTVDYVKKELQNHIGDTVTIKYSLGRNKYEEYDGKIKELYKHIFLIKTGKSGVKSFSYSDVITKTIRIEYS